MKKTFTLFIALCSFFMIAKGQVLLDETFDYSVDNLANELSWTTGGSYTTGTGRSIISPALTYSNAGGTYYLSGVGKTMYNDISVASSYTAYKPFTSTPVTTPQTVYLSFLYKAGVTQVQTNSEVFGLSTGTSAGAKVWVGKGVLSTTSFRFGTTRGSTTSSDIKWGTTEFADVDAVMLILLKYDFTNGTSSVFINPTVASASEPAIAETMDNLTTTIRTSLNNLWLRSNGSSVAKYNISGVRVSSSWADAVAAAPSNKLAPPIVGTASLITNSGFTANWTKVDNAVGYTIKVYSGTTQVSTASVTGQDIESAEIDGLISGTTYTYKVIAISDGVNYASSDPSAESAPFETLGLMPPVPGTATLITAHNFTANWEPVLNATGYDVQVYIGNFLVSTTNTVGQATASLAISGLASGTSYSFKVIAKGDGTILDSSPSASSDVFVTSYLGVDFIHTDFNDGTWGDVLPATPASGSFSSSSINEFILEKAVVRVVSRTDRRGDIHINDINLDKSTYNSNVVFPTVKSLEQIELHALTGTADRSFFLEEYNTSTSTWDEIGTYVYDAISKAYGADSIYVISISRTAPTTFRVRNNGTGGMYIAQVITRTTDPVTLTAPLVGEASDITTVGFTANWTPANFATGYEVFVYQDVNLVSTLVSRTVVSGQETSSLAITGLGWNTEYTYKVLAKGDGFVYYSDSYLSGPSSPFTTFNPIMLTAPLVGEATLLEGIGFTANWTPVDFALGYEVYVYQDVNLVSKTSVSGQAVASLAVTGLTLSTTYTYMVRAKGDSVNYANSDLSVASAPFTTLDYQVALPGLVPGNSISIYPNPVSDRLNFVYSLSQKTDVQVVLYSANGLVVKTLVIPHKQSAGTYSKSFDVSGLKNGIYLARLTADGVTKTTKVVINR